MSLEETRYRVDGGMSEIEVCARILSPSISCPIKFSFEVGLATDHQSAGVCVCTLIIAIACNLLGMRLLPYYVNMYICH